MGLEMLTVPLEDRPGELARVLQALGAHGVNLRAFSLDRGHLNLLTADAEQALRALLALGLRPDGAEVEEILLHDRPGELATLCKALAEVEVNIDLAFGLSNGNQGRIYLRVDDLPRAAPALQRHTRQPVVHAGLGRI